MKMKSEDEDEEKSGGMQGGNGNGDSLIGHDPSSDMVVGLGSGDPKRKEDAEKLSAARTTAKNWIAANHPDLIRKSESLAKLILLVGKDRAIAESENIIAKGDPQISNPFAYAKPIALKEVEQRVSFSKPPRINVEPHFED